MDEIAPTLLLKPGRERALARRHPWIFSGAVASVSGDPGLGETIAVRDAAGGFLAWAAYAPGANIRARVWSWHEDRPVDEAFFLERLQESLDLRRPMLDSENNAARLVNAESDGLPGLVVDQYADWLVVQCLSAGPERWRETIVDALVELMGCGQIYERSDVDVRSLEGLPARFGPLRGDGPGGWVEIRENGLRFLVDIAGGHKTGFYLDQRDNRRILGLAAGGKDILNCFAYTGGFSISALAGGARSVLSVETSGEAIRLGEESLHNNGMAERDHDWIPGDVFSELRRLNSEGHKFDLIVLDPPKFAPTRKHVERAARGYKDINLSAFRLLRPGGRLMTFSCSGGVSSELFQKIVAGAALDAGVVAQIEDRLGPSPDHPVALNFPEGNYLKGLVVRIGKGH